MEMEDVERDNHANVILFVSTIGSSTACFFDAVAMCDLAPCLPIKALLFLFIVHPSPKASA